MPKYKNEISVSLQAEKVTSSTEDVDIGATKTTQTAVNFSISFLYELILNKQSSFVTGVKFRRALNDIGIPVPAGGNSSSRIHFSIAENFLSLPILYKYNTRIVSLSAGTSVDYFLSWKQQKQKSYPAPLQSYDRFFDKKISFGLLTGISKKFALNKKVIIEPGIYYNSILSFKRTYYGVSLETKYNF